MTELATDVSESGHVRGEALLVLTNLLKQSSQVKRTLI
jgi:hypothetical protein